MRALNTSDFERLAKHAAEQYIATKTPLEKSLAKIAEAEGLNPDQIQNLVQLANTLTHLALFDSKSDDKIVEFEPADPEKVLSSVYNGDEPCSVETSGSSEAPVVTVESSGSGSTSPTMSREQDFFGDFNLLDKIKETLTGAGASSAQATAPSASSTSPGQRTMMIIKIRKVAEDLRHRKIAAAQEYKSELDKLATEFAKLYGPDYEGFEQSALAHRKEAAIPVLNDLRACLRMPAKKLAMVKSAGVIDCSSKEHKSLDKLIKLAGDFDDFDAACEYLSTELRGVL